MRASVDEHELLTLERTFFTESEFKSIISGELKPSPLTPRSTRAVQSRPSHFRKHFPAEGGLLRQAERSEGEQIQHRGDIKDERALQIF